MGKPTFTGLNRHLRHEKVTKKVTSKTQVKTSQVIIEAHRHEGIFIAKGVSDFLLTKVLEPGKNLYDDKKITVTDGKPIEYSVWNPTKSKLAASIINGIDKTFLKIGSTVLYIGAKNCSNMCHISDIVGPSGSVFAVSTHMKAELLYCGKQRSNVYPINMDPKNSIAYSMLVPMVDIIIYDHPKSNMTDIISENAMRFLKNNGNVLLFIDSDKVDKTATQEAVFALQTEQMKKHQFNPKSKIMLHPFHKSSALVSFVYRTTRAKKYN